VFIAKFPRGVGVSGTVVPDWMKLVDVAPFILDAAGLPIPKEMQGTPRPTSASSPVFSEEDHQGAVLTSVRLKTQGQEVKLIKANKDNPRGLAQTELYRTDEDPTEKTNLADERAELRATAGAELDKQAAVAKKGAAAAVVGELSNDAKKTLGNLGYMDDEKK
jgi:arylsulfatase A-like enzyme